MRGRWLRLAYNLHYHYWGSWSLARWLAGLPLVLAALLVFWRLVHGGLRAAPWSFWLPVAALVALALVVIGWIRWAMRHSYIDFVPAAALPAPAGCVLQPADKVLIRATGRFEVEGKTRFFANLLAYWRTFASREHAVMAIVHRTRFMLLGRIPEDDAGMWYIFWRPEKIVDLTGGTVAFGVERRAGLRVRYDTPEISDFQRRQLPVWQRRRKFSRRETVYLSFDDDEARRQVWADLLADAEAVREVLPENPPR